jgi:hypothetical protein
MTARRWTAAEWPTIRAAAVARIVERGAYAGRSAIARDLGVASHTVRDYDRAAGIALELAAFPEATEHEHDCAGCGRPITCRTGNHRRWCREGCRVAAFRRAHPLELERLVCACGAPYTHRPGGGRRPNACPNCRAVAVLARAARRAAAIFTEAARTERS